jgi:hypothetical protein
MTCQDANAISDYAAYLLAGMKADPAERNRRAASMVLSLIGQSIGLLKPTWNDLSFGKNSETSPQKVRGMTSHLIFFFVE